jgi:hypothetical protein
MSVAVRGIADSLSPVDPRVHPRELRGSPRRKRRLSFPDARCLRFDSMSA